MGEPEDADELVQKFGQVGRDRKAVMNPRQFLHYTAGDMVTAKRVLESDTEGNHGCRNTKPNGETTMDTSIAKLLVAACKVEELDRQYDNPVEDPKCPCRTCQEDPPTPCQHKCNCSGQKCEPESLPAPEKTQSKASQGPPISRPPPTSRTDYDKRSSCAWVKTAAGVLLEGF
jgi:superfamily II DNA helicase RecQ